MKQVMLASGALAVIAGVAWFAIGGIPSIWRERAVSNIPTSTPITVDVASDTRTCDEDEKSCSGERDDAASEQLCEFGVCADDPAEATVLTTIGESVDAIHLSITPLTVIEDSRCPDSVVCAGVGRAVVETRIETADGVRMVVFEIGQTFVIGNHRITFEALSPPARDGEMIPESAYRFVFTIVTG